MPSVLDILGDEINDPNGSVPTLSSNQASSISVSLAEQSASKQTSSSTHWGELELVAGISNSNKSFLLTSDRHTIGRYGGVSDLTITGATIRQFLSRKHVEIIKLSDHLVKIRDCGAGNGTAINGIKIKEAILRYV